MKVNSSSDGEFSEQEYASKLQRGVLFFWEHPQGQRQRVREGKLDQIEDSLSGWGHLLTLTAAALRYSLTPQTPEDQTTSEQTVWKTVLLQRGGQSPKKEVYTSTGRGARIGLRGQIPVDTKNREYTASTLPLIYYPNYAHRPCLYMFGTVRDSNV